MNCAIKEPLIKNNSRPFFHPDRFDLSLLRILIANLVETGKSLKFWMSNELPSPKDTSEKADLKRFNLKDSETQQMKQP